MKLFHKEECENNDKDEKLTLGYISEECQYCHEEMTDINDIWVDKDDRYCHEDCGRCHRLNIKKCKEIY